MTFVPQVIQGGRRPGAAEAEILPWRWDRVRWRSMPPAAVRATLSRARDIASGETPHPQREMARAVLRGLAAHAADMSVAAIARLCLQRQFGEIVPDDTGPEAA